MRTIAESKANWIGFYHFSGNIIGYQNRVQIEKRPFWNKFETHSSIAIILMWKRELVALLDLSSWCLVMVERLFLAVPRGCLRFVIVVFPDHTHLQFLRLWQSISKFKNSFNNNDKNDIVHNTSKCLVLVLSCADVLFLINQSYRASNVVHNSNFSILCLFWRLIFVTIAMVKVK